MQIVKQLALFVANRPGTLARVCEALSAAKINIHAISTSDTVDHIVIRMVVSDAAKAQRVFEDGTLVVATDVLMIEGRNKLVHWPASRASWLTPTSTSITLTAQHVPRGKRDIWFCGRRTSRKR